MPTLTPIANTLKNQRCHPEASLSMLNAAPSLCSRMKSRTGSNTTASNSSR